MTPCEGPWVAPFPSHLQAALDKALVYAPGHTQQTIEQAVHDETVQLWERGMSFCLTELREAPNGARSVHLFLAGGSLNELRPVYPVIEAWAKSQGATQMTMLGRHGWQRSFLTSIEGFQPTMTFYAKELV